MNHLTYAKSSIFGCFGAVKWFILFLDSSLGNGSASVAADLRGDKISSGLNCRPFKLGDCMSGVGNFLRTYEFLNLTKSVTETQMALYKEPNKTWSDVGNKLFNISWYNTLSVGAVGADVVTYLAVSSLRGIGLFHPLPPQPPVFPTPHDNAQFIDCAIKRALWDWNPSDRKDFEEGIESSLSDRWNVFQVVGEWSLAYSLENGEKGSYFKPTFLTISEPLENGATFRSASTDFAKLWKKEQKAILEALFHQSAAPSLGSKGKKVYQDLRSLASKLHQGNQIYLTAFGEHVKQKAAVSAATDSPPLYQERSYAPNPRPSLRSSSPSAPPRIERNIEVEMADSVAFLRDALQDLPSQKRGQVRSDILSDLSDRIDSSDQGSSKKLLASLCVLRGFQETFANGRNEVPSFISWDASLSNGKTLREVGQGFAGMRDQDFTQLRNAMVDPWLSRSLTRPLRERLDQANEFGGLVVRNRDFTKAYKALRIDLLAS